MKNVEKILAEFQHDVTVLKNFPIVIDSIFTKLDREVPDNLFVEKLVEQSFGDDNEYKDGNSYAESE